MRRCDDDWVNATQILKIAGYGKAQRTRILEKEVHQHEHRKIQGGFGRFQGTWIPLNLAKELADSHHLTREHVNVLYYNPRTDGPVPRKQTSKSRTRKHKNISSSYPATKKRKNEDKPKKRGRKSKKESSVSEKPPEQSESRAATRMPPTFGMFEKHPSKAKSNYVSRQDVPVQTNGIVHSQQQSEQNNLTMNSGVGYYADGTFANRPVIQQQQSIQQVVPSSFGLASRGQGFQPYGQPYSDDQQSFMAQQNSQFMQRYPPTYQDTTQDSLKFPRPDSSNSIDQDTKSSRPPFRQDIVQQDYFVGTQQLPTPQSQPQPTQRFDNNVTQEEDGFDYYTERLLTFFSNEDEPVPDFLLNPPDDFDVNKPIDNEGHTPLHWASALALPDIVELLISKGSNPLLLSNAGMNSLSKLIHFTNAYDTKNFYELLMLLRQCLIVPDAKGRTPLHYLVELSMDPEKYDCLRYYFDNIVTFVKGQQQEVDKISDANMPRKNLLSILINHEDNNGDTALMITLKIGSYDFSRWLIEQGGIFDAQDYSRIPPDLLKLMKLHSSNQAFTAQNGTRTFTGNVSEQNGASIIQKPVPNSNDTNNATLSVSHDSENKENIYESNNTTIRNTKMDGSLAIPSGSGVSQSVVSKSEESNNNTEFSTSTPSRKQDSSLLKYNDGGAKENVAACSKTVPFLITMVGELISEEIKSKNEEMKHNLNTLADLDKEVNSVTEKSSQLIKNSFNRIEQSKFNMLLNSTDRTDHVKLNKVLKGKLMVFKKILVTKRGQLYNGYERTQALEVAKSVNDEEMKIADYLDPVSNSSEMTDETLNLAVKLTLLQIERKKLINSKVESIIAGSEFHLLDDPLEVHEGNLCESVPSIFAEGFSDDTKMQAKLFLYKKLISNICSLPMEDITKDLLDGIEMRLKGSQISS